MWDAFWSGGIANPLEVIEQITYRHEERVLFPLIERALPEAELMELARALERAEAAG